MIQVLGSWEADPVMSGGARLTDIETGRELDLVLNRKVVAEYKGRLQRLQEDLALQARRCHATFVPIIADRGLASVCREDLCRSGVLRMA